MATTLDPILLAIVIAGLAMLLFYLYVGSMAKVFAKIGFTKSEVGTILMVTLIFSGVNIPLFPYNGWWVGINLGGALVPLVLCYLLVRSRRVSLAEGMIGVTIVATITYLVTRAEEGVGIVADIPIAFAPAIAAGFYSVSTFWIDIKKAAPLAYFSGILGTIIGADVFHLSEILAFEPPADEFAMLSIGGASIFDMVYITGIVAVFVDIFVFWVLRQERKFGFYGAMAEYQKGAEELPYAKETPAAPTLRPDRKGRV
jgi:uncharacterized membrane protein